MRLTDEEKAMRAGALGEPRRWAIEHEIMVGEFFDAENLVPVSQAHIMADTEVARCGRAALSRSPRGRARGRAPGPRADPDRSARARFHGLQTARPDRCDG